MTSLQCPDCGREISLATDIRSAEQKRIDQQQKWIFGISALSIILLVVLIAIFISNKRSVSTSSNPLENVNLRFPCYDAKTNKEIDNCRVTIQIIEQAAVTDSVVVKYRDMPIMIPIQRRLTVTAESENYVTYSEIFEYEDDGSLQTHSLRLTPK